MTARSRMNSVCGLPGLAMTAVSAGPSVTSTLIKIRNKALPPATVENGLGYQSLNTTREAMPATTALASKCVAAARRRRGMAERGSMEVSRYDDAGFCSGFQHLQGLDDLF